jgi:hypothetical protein
MFRVTRSSGRSFFLNMARAASTSAGLNSLSGRRESCEQNRGYFSGLFHADGCYFLNRVTSSAGRMYSYDRYFFTNESAEIKELFRWACGLIEVETRVAGRRNVSVARRSSVAILNTFLGPKR